MSFKDHSAAGNVSSFLLFNKTDQSLQVGYIIGISLIIKNMLSTSTTSDLMYRVLERGDIDCNTPITVSLEGEFLTRSRSRCLLLSLLPFSLALPLPVLFYSLPLTRSTTQSASRTPHTHTLSLSSFYIQKRAGTQGGGGNGDGSSSTVA